MQTEFPDTPAYLSPLALIGALESNAQAASEGTDVANASSVTIGAGAVIQAFAVIYRDAHIGRSAVISHHTVIGVRSHVGDATRIQPHCFIGSDVRIGPGCLVAGFVANRTIIGAGTRTFGELVHNNRRARPGDREDSAVIGDCVLIGRGASVIGRVVVGSFSVIGANCVITHDVPERVVMAGNPARIIDYRSPEEVELLSVYLSYQLDESDRVSPPEKQ